MGLLRRLLFASSMADGGPMFKNVRTLAIAIASFPVLQSTSDHINPYHNKVDTVSSYLNQILSGKRQASDTIIAAIVEAALQRIQGSDKEHFPNDRLTVETISWILTGRHAPNGILTKTPMDVVVQRTLARALLAKEIWVFCTGRIGSGENEVITNDYIIWRLGLAKTSEKAASDVRIYIYEPGPQEEMRRFNDMIDRLQGKGGPTPSYTPLKDAAEAKQSIRSASNRGNLVVRSLDGNWQRGNYLPAVALDLTDGTETSVIIPVVENYGTKEAIVRAIDLPPDLIRRWRESSFNNMFKFARPADLLDFPNHPTEYENDEYEDMVIESLQKP